MTCRNLSNLKYLKQVACCETNSITQTCITIDLRNIRLPTLNADRAYFKRFYWRVGDEALDAESIMGMFKLASDAGPTNFAYRSADEAFKMIEDSMVAVVIPETDEAVHCIESLVDPLVKSVDIERRLQRYSVSVPDRDFRRMIANGTVSFAVPNLRGERFPVLSKGAEYLEDVGLEWEVL